MYRAGVVAFCRRCGAAWLPDAIACESCGEPLEAETSAARTGYRPQAAHTWWVLGSVAVTGLAAAATGIQGYLTAAEARTHGTWMAWTHEAFVDMFSVWILGVCLTELLFIATAGLFCVWLFEAGRNLRALGRLGLRFPEESRVWWFAVPLARLVVPYLALRELSQASRVETARRWRDTSPHLLLPVWWLAWIVHSICFKCASFAGYLDMEGWIEVPPSSVWAGFLCSYPALAVASVGMYVVTRDVARAQRDAYAVMHPDRDANPHADTP